jgi:hypothetical protein
MDPNANLARQRELVKEIIHHFDNPAIAGAAAAAADADAVTLAYELADHVTALDEWIMKGGALPTDWRK